jgi:lipoate-protein ligase A
MNKLIGKKFKYLKSTLKSAHDNMDIDKQICKDFEMTNTPVFRLYSWENSFTVGISQDCDKYIDLKQKFKNNCAKRITGGGILFHGNDISYSIILPTTYFELYNVKESYEFICSFLFTFYSSLGLKPSYAKDLKSIALLKNPFCQIGYEPYDIVIDGKKIGGNAQKRTKKYIFQHGSIQVFSMGDEQMYGNSLQDFGLNLSLEEVRNKLKQAFIDTFKVTLEL